MTSEAEKTILVVEDDSMNSKLVRDVLEYKGYRILEASNTEQCLELAPKCIPDLILMDIHLPGMDGIEATRRLKENPKTEGIAVIAMTADAMPAIRERILAAGCLDYIAKPFDIHDFLDKIVAYIGDCDRQPAPDEGEPYEQRNHPGC